MASAGHGPAPAGTTEDIRLVVDTIPGFVWSTRPDGSAEFFNRCWLEYTGLSEEQALNWGWNVAIHPDDLPRMLQAFHEALDLRRSFELESRLRRRDGAFRWFLFRGNPVLDGLGRVVKWCGTNTDIEDRKRMDHALRNSEQKFHLIVDGIAGLVVIVTAAGEIEFANHQVLEYFGKTTEQLKEWPASEAVHPDDLPELISAWRHSVEMVGPYDIDHRLRRVDGAYRWFRERGVPRRDAEGRVVHWYVLLTDIDERKQAEERLRESEADLHEAERLSHTGSWKHNLSSLALTISPEVHRIFAIGPQEDASQVDFFFGRIHPDDRQREEENYERANLSKTAFESDYRIVLPDGSIKHIHNVGHPVLNESGDIKEFIGTTMDITAQVKARTELETALAEIKTLKEQLYRENLALRDEVDRVSMFEQIVGNSHALRAVLSRVSKVAPTDSSVLITGETGTGKELVARAIHKRSRRSSHAFVSVNCAAIPHDLIASELFGHEKGAFTGATRQRLGRFEMAEGGTVFLDEVGELPAETQVALLHVLQEHEFERVGGNRSIQTDVRVIAATNRDLQEAIAGSTFRTDLFYRLNVFPIEVPPLRERREDIPMLVEYFIHRYAKKAGKSIRGVNTKSLELLQSYPWPGNIRELQNVIERSVILCDTENFSVDESWLSRQPSASGPKKQPELSRNLAAHEKEMIETALRESGGRVSGPAGAAAKLGIPGSTLDSKIRSLKINKNRFKTSDPLTDRV